MLPVPTAGSAAGALIALLAVLTIALAAAAWVYTDAKASSGRGRPVTVSVGSLRISTPTAWFLACLVLSEMFLPLYIDSRETA